MQELQTCVGCGQHVPCPFNIHVAPNGYGGKWRDRCFVVNDETYPTYACSKTCVTKARLADAIPFSELMHDVVPSRFLNEPYTRLSAWRDTEGGRFYRLINEWADSNPERGFLFYGNVGRGKTCLAVALLHECRKRAMNVRFISGSELHQRLTALNIAATRESYTYEKQQKEFEDIFFETPYCGERQRRWDVIVLDDFTDVEFSNPQFTQLMQDFYNYDQLLVITMNGTPDEMEKRMDVRIASRLKKLCKAELFSGADYRVSR